jgi:chromosome segregation ATPase
LFKKGEKEIFRISLIISLLFILLSGCSGPSPEKNIYTIFEKVVTLEDSFKEQQQPLEELEKKESELYNEIMDIGLKDFEKVVALSNEAVTVLEDRETRIEAEYESIKASKEEFELVNKEIEKIKDEKLAEKAKEIKTTMENRYSAYESLFESYKTSISYDKELYTMLQKEDLTIEELQVQIKKVNDAYKIVMQQNDVFNELTEEYNKLKMEFYENASLNVDESK